MQGIACDLDAAQRCGDDFVLEEAIIGRPFDREVVIV